MYSERGYLTFRCLEGWATVFLINLQQKKTNINSSTKKELAWDIFHLITSNHITKLINDFYWIQIYIKNWLIKSETTFFYSAYN